MGADIDAALAGWDYEPGQVHARIVHAADGRDVIQMRVDLGVLQMETDGRPDGSKPYDRSSMLEYLREMADEDPATPTVPSLFIMSDEHCVEADREFVQFYHRRLCWLALEQHDRAVADADHTLALMDVVKRHSPTQRYTLSHERYRPFVWFHRTQAIVHLALQQEDAQGAVEEIDRALKEIGRVYGEYQLAEQMDADPMVQALRKLEEGIRNEHAVGPSLHEQIAQAVADEDYELAARLRDKLRDHEKGEH